LVREQGVRRGLTAYCVLCNPATMAGYYPAGRLRTVMYESNLVTNLFFNNRLQPCRIAVISTGTAPTSCADSNKGNVLDAIYDFAQGTADNGNVYKITDNRTSMSGRSVNYDYDALNRIKDAYTDGNLWGETFTIDPWGNLYGIGAYSGKPQIENLSQTSNNSNQFAGMSYDAAGDLLNDGLNNYTYDGEGRIATGAGVTYAYDGDGKRVKKSNGKLHWYGAGSDPLMETDFSGNLQYEYIFFGGKRIARQDGSGNRNYYFADHLGTARVVTNASGSVLDDSDFCPFGRECYVALSSSGNAYKFTGKERDPESGLDEFGARYYTSQYGRFMTVDEFPGGIVDPFTGQQIEQPGPLPYADVTDPQTLNKYAYVRNSPLRYVDPNGHEILYDDRLQNAQLVKDTVSAILANPNTSAYLSGYVGKENPNLVIMSGDLSNGDTRVTNADGTTTTTKVMGNTDPGGQSVDGGPVTQGEASITLDYRNTSKDVVHTMVHESEHAGEARKDIAKFTRDAKTESSNPNHDQRPQERRAIAADKKYSKQIARAVKQIEKRRKKEDDQ
jgi:RHS repeat-associated protein